MIPNKESDTVVKSFYYKWCLKMGMPSRGFWSNNGKELQNDKMNKLIEKCGLTVKYWLSYSPWSNRINEWNNGMPYIIQMNAMGSYRKMSQSEAVDLASYVHFTNVNK